MRLPYLQVTQETWTNARMLSRMLSIGRGEAFALLCDLWAWALDLGPDDRPPDGICASPRAAIMLAGALDWSADPDALVEALAEVGVIAKLDVGIRVRGMDRYKATWEKNRRKGHGKDKNDPHPGGSRAGPGRVPVFSRSEPDRQTQTQTQTHRTTPPAPQAGCPPLIEAVASVFREERNADYGQSFADEQAVRELYRLSNGSDAEILRRFRNGLRRKRYPLVSSLKELAKAEAWNHCATDEPAPPGAKAPVRKISAADHTEVRSYDNDL